MKRMFSLFVLLFALCFLCTSVNAGEYKWTPDGLVEISFSSPPAPQMVTIPPGMHAHTRTDGTTFIHGDENLGDPAAHAGVARPWPKTGYAGDTVLLTAPTFNAYGEICPNGVCPRNGARTTTVSSQGFATSTPNSEYSTWRERRRADPWYPGKLLGRIFGGCR